MVASTDIKFYVHTNNNAPQLTNNYGCMLDVLDATMLNGVQVGTVNSLTASGKIVTAVFSTAHNLLQYQVIKITGANQTEYNIEARVLTVPNTTTITFELVANPSVMTATGTINCSLPPLGWEKPFSSTSATGGKGAYRSKNLLLPSRPFLRVVDELDPAYTASYAKYAKVGIVEDMTDIDTLLGAQTPYDSNAPTKNWVGAGSGTSAINGWAKWYYATGGIESNTISKTTTPSNGNRAWIIVGNSEGFYILNKAHHIVNEKFCIYGVGILNNLSKIGALPYFLAASNDYSPAANTLVVGYSALTTTRSNQFVFMLRNYKAQAIMSLASSRALCNSVADYCGYTPSFVAPDSDISVFSSEYLIAENSNIPRGTVPILRWLYQLKPYNHLQTLSESGRMLLACSCVSFDYDGQILIDLGGL